MHVQGIANGYLTNDFPLAGIESSPNRGYRPDAGRYGTSWACSILGEVSASG
jgi:hypothetical protein